MVPLEFWTFYDVISMINKSTDWKNAVNLLNCLNCDSLRWSHIHFICIPTVHIISFCDSFLSRVDELNKLACLQCMGLHSSAVRTLQRERRGHGFESHWSPEKPFLGAILQLLKLWFTAMVTYSFHYSYCLYRRDEACWYPSMKLASASESCWRT